MGLRERLTNQPSVLYRRERGFYWRYDGGWLLALWTAMGAAWLSGWRGLWPTWSDAGWSVLALLPLAIYLHVAANAVVHNCCHANLPRPINRLVGELLGLLVIVRYAPWEFLHRRHHRYPDDPERDPHPCQPSFARFLFGTMFTNIERQLHAIRYELHGDSPAARRRERWRTLLTLSTDTSTLLAWGLLLGWPVFLLVFVPAQAVGWTILAHFNWITHGGDRADHDYRPRDLDHGVYWLANRVLFGLYMHATHHRNAGAFNPLRAARRAVDGGSEGAVAMPPTTRSRG